MLLCYLVYSVFLMQRDLKRKGTRIGKRPEYFLGIYHIVNARGIEGCHCDFRSLANIIVSL